MSTRVILPTPCRNPHGTGRQPCPGRITWEEHGRRRLGHCNTCGHEYAHDLGTYDRPATDGPTASTETADA